MTKYYVGYLQGNNEYVYIAGVDNGNVKISTTLEGALSFTDIGLAENLRDVAEDIVKNQEYNVLKITVTIQNTEVM